jgi:hypothetical protein
MRRRPWAADWKVWDFVSGPTGKSGLADAGRPVVRQRETCPWKYQGQFFLFFVGMQAAYFGSTNGDPLDSIQRAGSAAGQRLFVLGDRVPLRADLGQSQSGNSSLSPQAYRVETRPPNWPYRRLDRSPLSMPLDTSVGAPLWARRSGLPKVAGQIGGLR